MGDERHIAVPLRSSNCKQLRLIRIRPDVMGLQYDVRLPSPWRYSNFFFEIIKSNFMKT